MTVLLVGSTGHMGSRIASALVKKDIELRAMVRSRKPEDDKKLQRLQWLESLGADLVEGDVNDSASLERACTGVNTVLSALSGFQSREDVVVAGQLNLLNAAKKTGVSRFIPADYSSDYFQVQLGENYVWDQRLKVAQAVKESGLDYTFIMNGAFMESFFSPFFQIFNLEAGTVEYWGDGDTKFDLTTTDDVAKYTAEAVVDPLAINTAFQVAGDVMTMKEVIAAYEEVKGRKLTARSKGSLDDLKVWIEETKARIPVPWVVVPAQCQLGMALGKGKLHNLVNDRYPHIKPTSVKEYVAVTATFDGGGVTKPE